jgi:hypothetical protein
VGCTEDEDICISNLQCTRSLTQLTHSFSSLIHSVIGCYTEHCPYGEPTKGSLGKATPNQDKVTKRTNRPQCMFTCSLTYSLHVSCCHKHPAYCFKQVVHNRVALHTALLLTVDSSSASAMTFEPSAMPGRYLGFSCVLLMISVSLEPCRQQSVVWW